MVPTLAAGPMHDHDLSMDAIVPKTEPTLDGNVSISSSVSTPEPEEQNPDVAQTQKRKGGRKPIYATSEERKQRNRQAQAAFRERRTEYIKQLESTIKRNEDSLQSLQQSHRSAADECLMLRYKNSLLERILMEKGIDVQAELRLKAGSNSATVPPAKSTNKQPLPLERAALSRTSAQRRQASGAIAPKPDRDGPYSTSSPQGQPTPTSHVSSPSTGRSPGFTWQGAMSPKGSSDFRPRSQAPLLPHPTSATTNLSQQSSLAGMGQMRSMDSYAASSMMPGGTMAPHLQSYYSAPFQKHYDQLEQEYDAQADMVDEADTNGSEANAYDFTRPPVAPGHVGGALSGVSSMQAETGQGMYNTSGSLFSQFEPVLDSDTFGLSASMHFQTPFSYEQEMLRQ